MDDTTSTRLRMYHPSQSSMQPCLNCCWTSAPWSPHQVCSSISFRSTVSFTALRDPYQMYEDAQLVPRPSSRRTFVKETMSLGLKEIFGVCANTLIFVNIVPSSLLSHQRCHPTLSA